MMNYMNPIEIEESDSFNIHTFRHDDSTAITGILGFPVNFRSLEDPKVYMMSKSTERGWKARSVHIELTCPTLVHLYVQHRDGHIGLTPTERIEDLITKAQWHIPANEKFCINISTEMNHYENVESMFSPILIEMGVNVNETINWKLQVVYESVSHKGVCTNSGGHTISDNLIYGPRWAEKTKDGSISGVDKVISGVSLVKKESLVKIEIIDREEMEAFVMDDDDKRYVTSQDSDR